MYSELLKLLSFFIEYVIQVLLRRLSKILRLLRRKNKEVWGKLRIDHAPNIYNNILADIEVQVQRIF